MKAYHRIQIPIFFRIISWFLVAFLIPFQIILQKLLFEISKDSILSIQDNRSQAGINFFTLFTYLGNGAFLVAIAPGIFNFLHPKSSSTIIIFSVLVHYLGNLLALVFQEPRPFWYSSAIKGEVCEEGYGNPCLTVLVVGTLVPILFIEVFHSTRLRYVPYGCLVVFLGISSFNGIYLGEAFPHQVVTTLFLDFALVTVYFSLARQISGFCFASCYNYEKNRKYIIYWVVFVFASFAIVSIVQHILYITPPDYPKTISNALRHCSNSYNPNGEYNYKLTLEVFYALGFVSGNIRNSRKMSVYWMITSWWKRILRFILSSGVNVSLYYCFKVIPATDFFMTCTFHYAIPYFLMSYVFTCVLPILFSKCGLVNKLSPEVDSELILAQIEDKVVI